MDRYHLEDFTFQFCHETREKYWQLQWNGGRSKWPSQSGLSAVAELEKLGKLDRVITQNIMPSLRWNEEKVIQLHGSIFVSCLSCHKRYDRDEIQERIKKGQKAPRCDDCGGILKPATVSFGQSMPEKETQEAYHRSSLCDLFIVVGSSLVVQPAASMPLVAKKNGASLVIINRDPTPYVDIADAVIHGQAGPTMAGILEHVKKGLGVGV
jgi:NAD-dependent deacetylase